MSCRLVSEAYSPLLIIKPCLSLHWFLLNSCFALLTALDSLIENLSPQDVCLHSGVSNTCQGLSVIHYIRQKVAYHIAAEEVCPLQCSLSSIRCQDSAVTSCINTHQLYICCKLSVRIQRYDIISASVLDTVRALSAGGCSHAHCPAVPRELPSALQGCGAERHDSVWALACARRHLVQQAQVPGVHALQA